jgi:hypothetical protein
MACPSGKAKETSNAFVMLPDIELAADDLAEINRAAAEIRIKGERYPEQLMATTRL